MPQPGVHDSYRLVEPRNFCTLAAARAVEFGQHCCTEKCSLLTLRNSSRHRIPTGFL